MASFGGAVPEAGTSGRVWEQLEAYDREVQAVILARQHPVTGLLPASTAVSSHGDYRDAWVRDNVYSVLAVWGLALAYRKRDEDSARAFELGNATTKLMRGLLAAMMRQADKVEAFKASLAPRDALHAKYATASGDAVMADDAWGHLQLDATSLYLLMLAQMTASGLSIVSTRDEVAFIQNLVFYIARAYRTPDYGIWERGNKANHGEPELNASSVAMAKAALEALTNFNLYGVRGDQASVIHVLPDDVARARITLEAMLPRESSSKEVDAALLSAIGFPAFAVEDEGLVAETRRVILGKLSGRYGLKRFLRDGHQTAIEDPERLHYEPHELLRFEHLESEWPLFWTYLLLECLFRGDVEGAEGYRARLSQVALEQDGYALLPELYCVPAESVEAERAAPGSQARTPNQNVPLVWAQSLYVLGRMLHDGLLSVYDVDPLARHQASRRGAGPVVQLALVAENARVQRELADRGVLSETLEQIRPVTLQSAKRLAERYQHLGQNDKLGLTGRPAERLQTLSTSRVFRLEGERVVCPPAFFAQRTFYLSLDPHFLAVRFRAELAYVHRYWSLPGRPTVTLFITETLLEGAEAALFELLGELRGGRCNGVPVTLAPLALLMQTAATARMDKVSGPPLQASGAGEALTRQRYLDSELAQSHPLAPEAELALELERDLEVLRARLLASRNLFEQVEILTLCAQHLGLEHDLGLGAGAQVGALLEEVYARAGELRLWAVIRRAAGILGKVDVGLSDSLTDLLVRHKTVLIGKAYSERSLITRPLPQGELLARIGEFCRDDIRDRVLTQELIIYLSLLMREQPTLFEGFLSLRVGHLILLLASDLALEHGLSQDEGYERLMREPPSAIQARLRGVLGSYLAKERQLERQEGIQARRATELSYPDQSIAPDAPLGGWWLWRQREGTLSRMPPDFFASVWHLLSRCRGVVIGDKLERRNRLDSRLILSETTPGERNFALRVEHLLNKIHSPEYRQVTIEALVALARLLEQNGELLIDDYLVLDVITGHAVRLAYLDVHPERGAHYDADKAAAWAAFYERPPGETSGYLVTSLDYLLGVGSAVAAAGGREPGGDSALR